MGNGDGGGVEEREEWRWERNRGEQGVDVEGVRRGGEEWRWGRSRGGREVEMGGKWRRGRSGDGEEWRWGGVEER